MAKPKLYTERRILRFSKETDAKLLKHAKVLQVEPAVAGRQLVERGLELGDKPALALLKHWYKLFRRKANKHPANQNWNEVNRLADNTGKYLEDQK